MGDSHVASHHLKLRSTCDRCATAKLRCEKQHPVCQRCQQLGQSCVYGPSLRKGKPASKKQKVRELNTPSDCTTPETQADYLQPNLWQNLDNDIKFSALPWMIERTQGSENSEAATLDASLPLNMMWPQSESWGKVLQPTHDFSSEGSLVAEKEELSTPIMALQASSNKRHRPMASSLDPTSDSSGCCTSDAIKTLSDLYQLKCSCQHADSSCWASPTAMMLPIPSSDFVLLTVRNAVETLSRLVECNCVSCSDDVKMQFLFANIATKALCWYKAIYNANIYTILQTSPFPTRLSSLADTHHTPSNLAEAPASMVESTLMAKPLTISSLHLPQATELRMKAQLLLCELQPLLQACNTLNKRSQRAEKGQGEEVVCEVFGTFLQHEAGDLKRCLEAICEQVELRSM